MAKRERQGRRVEEPATSTGSRKRSVVYCPGRAAYEQLMDEIRGYCQQARELREQAAELQRSGRTDFQVREEIQAVVEPSGAFGCGSRSEGWTAMPASTRTHRQIEQEASDCRQLVQYNQTVLVRQEQELEDAKAAAVKMVQDAEERLKQTRQIAEKEPSLQNWRAKQMSNHIPQKYQGVMHDLSQKHKGTGKRIELPATLTMTVCGGHRDRRNRF